jgi:hypothetical protein
MYGRLGPGLRRGQRLDAANALVAERSPHPWVAFAPLDPGFGSA